MPFDALVAAPRQSTVSEALEHHGLTPVAWKVLAAHKLAQLEKFGPSFWYRHQAAVSLALVVASPVVGALAGAINGFSGHSGALTIGSSFAWMCLVAVVTGTGLIRMRAGSHWRERWLPAGQIDDLGVPEPIAAAARLLQRELPGATLILGELMREEAVLDPYLLLEYGHECVCLGIWENDQVIAGPDQPSAGMSHSGGQ
jgi:hypothetical protein